MFSFDSITEALPGVSFESIDVNGTPAALIKKEEIVKVAKLLHDQFGFVQMIDAFGMDRNEKHGRFEVTYNIRNHQTKERIFLKVRCDEKDPHVPSLAGIWSGANWNEREAYDMYGVIFDGHPDMRRMYMPEGFEYYPLRKDFPLMGIAGSIPLPRTDGSDKKFKIPDPRA